MVEFIDTREEVVFRDQLKNAGLKVTVPRLRVLQVMEEGNPRHLSAEDIFTQLKNMNESIGLATVYRVLTQFEEAGLVERHNFAESSAVYELANADHHDHMVDLDTGEIIEFVDDEIEELQKQIAQRLNYELVDHQLVLYVRKLDLLHEPKDSTDTN